VRTPSCIETHTGGFYDFAFPLPEQIELEDIAYALSKVCRFGGHCARFYSVAEHAVNVRRLVREHGRPDLGLAALHHDSHEAYIGDIPSPLKRSLGVAVEEVALAADMAIARWLGFEVGDLHEQDIKAADILALRHEAAALKPSKGAGEHWGYDFPAHRPDFINCLTPDAAARAFIQAHYDETGEEYEPRWEVAARHGGTDQGHEGTLSREG